MAKKVHRPGGGGKCRGGVDLGVEGFTALVGQLNRKLLDWEAISSVPTQMILDQKGGGSLTSYDGAIWPALEMLLLCDR